MILYRVLCIIINMFCAFIAGIVILALPFVLAYPFGLPCTFLLLCVVLYGWFGNRFYVFVTLRKQKMSKKQKDWLQVNAIVSFLFALWCIIMCIYLYYDRETVDEILASIPTQDANSKQLFLNSMLLFFMLFVLLVIHIVWTYILVRKHKEYFIE